MAMASLHRNRASADTESEQKVKGGRAAREEGGKKIPNQGRDDEERDIGGCRGVCVWEKVFS